LVSEISLRLWCTDLLTRQKFDIFYWQMVRRYRRLNLFDGSERLWAKKSRIVPFPLFALKASFRIISRPEATESVAGSMEIDASKALKTSWRPEISLNHGLQSALQSSKLPT
jgi:UDP-glucose 4-epimerase